MKFASDNCSTVAPEIMAAIAEANAGSYHSYGGDPWSERLDALFAEIFEHEVRVFPVLTGGAANGLVLGTLVPPYGVTYCHQNAHINTDECGGPGLFTGGAKLKLIEGDHGKITPEGFAQALSAMDRGVHSAQGRLLSLTQGTEWGTVYSPAELCALTAIARDKGLPVHMDGARFANAVAALGCAPADITWRAGIDVLSFGATKNGAMLAEAVVFFDTALVRDFAFRRKQAGQLLSKMRFVSAQWEAYLTDGLWLRLATHANTMAKRLHDGLAAIEGVSFGAPVDMNELFVRMPESMIAALEAAGGDFYRWEDGMIRLVTSWATTEAEVDRFVDVAATTT